MSNIRNDIKDTSDDLKDFIIELNKIIKKSKKCKKTIKQINIEIKDKLKKDECEKLIKIRDEQYILVKQFNASVSLLNIEASEILTEVIKHKNIEHLLK